MVMTQRREPTSRAVFNATEVKLWLISWQYIPSNRLTPRHCETPDDGSTALTGVVSQANQEKIMGFVTN